MKSTILTVGIVIILTISAFGQNANQATSQPTAPPDTTKKLVPLPSVMGGIGVLVFNGNIGKGSGVTAYSTVRGGYTLGVEERPIPLFGIELSGTLGKLSSSERSTTPVDNENFQSNVFQGDLTFYLHLVNNPTAAISPFIYAGISFMSYQTYTDSLSANGTPYYYWTDGTIRNEPQNAPNVLTSQIIQRDYTYETPLGSGTAISTPVGLGAKIHITDNLCINVQAAYYFAFTHSIEHYVPTAAANEKYLFSVCTLEYHFTRKVSERDDPRYEKVNFDASFITDTAKKSDEISKDKEAQLLAIEDKNSSNVQTVNHDEAKFWADPMHNQRMIDSINHLAPTKHMDPDRVPARIRSIDKNHDGFITSQEISEAIDDFFTGTSELTIADINYAIDYFFDQSDQ